MTGLQGAFLGLRHMSWGRQIQVYGKRDHFSDGIFDAVYSITNPGYRIAYFSKIPMANLLLIKPRVPEDKFFTNTHHYAMTQRVLGTRRAFTKKYPCETRKSFKIFKISSVYLRYLLKFGYFIEIYYVVPGIFGAIKQ